MAKSDNRPPRIERLWASTPQGSAGVLTKTGQHVFIYNEEAWDCLERAISLTMPPRPESYATTPMLPAFQTFLPEGFLKERIVSRYSKVMRVDDMALLAFSTGGAIGRVRLRGSESEDDASDSGSARESLRDILADQGSRDLFEYLCDRYLIGSGIAGVQPKVLVPVDAEEDNDAIQSAHPQKSERRGADRPTRDKASLTERATLRTYQWIIKAGDDAELPHLAENEFHCLSIAWQAGLSTPILRLSEDMKRLAVRRFDIHSGSNQHLGFEDMVSLLGRTNETKYEGSYELIAKVIRANVYPGLQLDALRRFFETIVLSVVVRNGDAHLKNFGLLYTDPTTNDCTLSPTYDIVNTTSYLPADRLALSLGKTKQWPSRRQLADFGRTHCEVNDADGVIERIITAAMSYQPEMEGAFWPKLRGIIEGAAGDLQMA